MGGEGETQTRRERREIGGRENEADFIREMCDASDACARIYTYTYARTVRAAYVYACARFGAGGHTFNFAGPITKSDMHHSEINSQQQRRGSRAFCNEPKRLPRAGGGEGEGEEEEVSEENEPRRGGR